LSFEAAKKPRIPNTAIAIFCFFLVAVLFNVLGYAVTRFLHWRSLWASIAAQIAVIVALPLLFTLIFRYDYKTTFRLRKLKISTLLICMLAGLAAQFAVRFPDVLVRWGLQAIFGTLYIPDSGSLSDNTFLGMVLLTVALLILAPTCEELLNRGFLMSGFHQNGESSFWRTVLWVGIFFGIFHQYMYTFTGTMLGGFLLAYLALSTGSIYASMAAHFGFNLFPAVVYWILFIFQNTINDVLGESSTDSGLMVVTPELVTSSLILSLLGSGLLFLALRSVSKRAAASRTGLVLGYSGLVKDLYPDSPYYAQGDYYSPGYPYLYGFYGYTGEAIAPDYWSAPGVERAGAPYQYAPYLATSLTRTNHPYAAPPDQTRYIPPGKRPLPTRAAIKLRAWAIVALAATLIFFFLTCLTEVGLRAKGRECELDPRKCESVLPKPTGNNPSLVKSPDINLQP
jgi:membrane protease YdiL (CAAX protease family)